MAKTLEEIAKQLKKMKFKSALVGGVDKKDVWKKIERLNDDYMQYIEQQRIGYEAVLAEKDRMIAGGITVNAAQILPGPGAMPPMDPGMMGGMPPFGDPSMAQFGDPSSTASGPPSPQGEGIYGGPQDLPLEGAQGPGDLGFAPTGALRPGDAGLHERRQVAAQPTDEVFYPMPPFDSNMMPAVQQPSPWGEGAPTGADEGAYAGMPPFDPAMIGMPPILDENGNPLPMPPFDLNMMPPQGFDPTMMGMPPMPMAPGADFAPPAAGFEPDWGNPAPPMPQAPAGSPAPPIAPHPVNMQQPPAGPQMPPYNPGPSPWGAQGPGDLGFAPTEAERRQGGPEGVG